MECRGDKMSADFNRVQKELQQAQKMLNSLEGSDIDAINIKSLDYAEAPFLARIVSKLSPMVGNLMEQRIVSLLSESSSDLFDWKRQDPGFPDAVLVDLLDEKISAGYEIKAWYVLSTEITGRFRESLNLLKDKNISVVIVAWCLSDIIFGRPKILGTLVIPAEELAMSRDNHYYNPPEYLVLEPNDTSNRTSNLQQSNVLGYKLQEDKCDVELLAEARNQRYLTKMPSSPESQAEATKLWNHLSYRGDTNFAKIDRVQNVKIEKFKKNILETQYLGRTIQEWIKIFRNLDNKNQKKRIEAENQVKLLYKKIQDL